MGCLAREGRTRISGSTSERLVCHPPVPVESLLKPGLVEEVADETDAPAQHEQTIQEPVLEIVLSLHRW